MGSKKKHSQRQRADVQRPLISVCMIVRDEEANLERCLRSVRPVADELIVVDTGSRDRTVEIARQHGAKVSYFEWCDDFAAARNAALAQATGRWVLQMDADEELVVKGTGPLRRLVSGVPPKCWGFFIPVRLYELEGRSQTCNTFYRLLLFRNHPDLRYFSRVHEQIRYVGHGPQPEFRYDDDVVVDHYGYLPDQVEAKKKHERNLRLLRLAVDEEPDEPFHHFNLGQEYLAMGRHAEAVEPLRRALALCKDPRLDYLPMAYTLLIQALNLSGLACEALAVIVEAERCLPRLTADFHHTAGTALQAVGQSEQALAYFQRAIEVGQVRAPVFSHYGAYTWLPRLSMGMIYESRGQLERARGCYEEALTYVPEHPGLSCRLAAVLAGLGQPERALEQVKRVLQAGLTSEQICWELVQVCEQLDNAAVGGQRALLDLQEVGGELVQRIPPTSELGAKLARTCVRFGQFERGVAAANAVLEKGEDLLARTQRGICFFQLGRYQEAADDFTAAMAAESESPRVPAQQDDVRQQPGLAAAADVVSVARLQSPPANTQSAPDLNEVYQSLIQQQETYQWLRGTTTEERDLEQTPVAVPGKRPVPASIVISTFNQVERTRRCLEAIVRNTPEDLYEVVVVDNASSDGTGDFLGLLEGDVKIIANETSVELAAAWNQGAQTAEGEYLVFLRDDAEPQPGWLEKLIALAESDPLVGVVGAKLVHPDGTLLAAGAVISPDGALSPRGEGLDAADPEFNFVREVDWCSAVALLIRKEVWDGIGGFDVEYDSADYQAADLCFAARQAGYRVLYQPAAVVTHHLVAAAIPR